MKSYKLATILAVLATVIFCACNASSSHAPISPILDGDIVGENDFESDEDVDSEVLADGDSNPEEDAGDYDSDHENTITYPTTPQVNAPQYVTERTAGWRASVQVQEGCSYQWTISGGTISGGQGTPQVTFSALSTGALVLGCTATNASGLQSDEGRTVVEVVPTPKINSFNALKSTVSQGGQTTLIAIFSDGIGSIDNGIGDNPFGVIESGAETSTGVLITTTIYSLTVTNAANTSVTQQVTIKVVARPVIESFVAIQSPVTIGNGAHLNALYSNGTGIIDNDIGPVLSGGEIETQPLLIDTAYTLTVTNEASDYISKQVTIAVVPMPTISSFVAARSPITTGTETTLVAIYSDGSGSINHEIGQVASGLSVTTGALMETTTFTLTVTNEANSIVTKDVIVEVRGGTKLTYEDPPVPTDGFYLVLNGSSTDTHLLLDLMGPPSLQLRGLSLALKVDNSMAIWGKDTETGNYVLPRGVININANHSLFVNKLVRDDELHFGLYSSGSINTIGTSPLATILLVLAPSATVGNVMISTGTTKGIIYLDGGLNGGQITSSTLTVGTLIVE